MSDRIHIILIIIIIRIGIGKWYPSVAEINRKASRMSTPQQKLKTHPPFNVVASLYSELRRVSWPK